MTTSPDNNRLDRIERMLEAIVTTVGQNNQQIEANSRQIEANTRKTEEIDRLIEINTRENAELRATVNSLVQIVEVHQTNFEVIVAEIRQIIAEIRDIKAEIRGLQTENRRILDHLFGEQGDRE